MRVLLVRPPKFLWPYMNEQDNFLLPQALVCLGAATRQRGHEPVLLDCMPLQMGWRSLEQTIRRLRPDVVCAGDSETLYQHESGRVFALAKAIDPHVFTIAGGVHFSHAGEHAFAHYPIDAIVRGEGEETLGELLDAVAGRGELSSVAGLALPDGAGGVRYTAHRPLIADLDALPLPAYDLAPMHRYGASRYLFSPGGTTIHHSRGCIDGCAYCACWLQMSQASGAPPAETLRPRYRTRSVESTVEEMLVLRDRYGKSCLVFVDDTWNVDPQWGAKFAETLLRRRLGMSWFAFMRADFLRRDEESGLLAELVRAGLTHLCIGMERADDGELAGLGKHNMVVERNEELVRTLRRRYPSLFVQTTFLVGLPGDSAASLDRLLQRVESIDPDYPAFHPLTPVPGTALWREARDQGRLEIKDFARYDWMTPVMGTDHLTREELEYQLWRMNKRYMNPLRVLRGLFSPHAYRRRMYVWWLMVSLRVVADYLLDRALPARSTRRKTQLSEYVGMLKPDWYDR